MIIMIIMMGLPVSLYTGICAQDRCKMSTGGEQSDHIGGKRAAPAADSSAVFDSSTGTGAARDFGEHRNGAFVSLVPSSRAECQALLREADGISATYFSKSKEKAILERAECQALLREADGISATYFSKSKEKAILERGDVSSDCDPPPEDDLNDGWTFAYPKYPVEKYFGTSALVAPHDHTSLPVAVPSSARELLQDNALILAEVVKLSNSGLPSEIKVLEIRHCIDCMHVVKKETKTGELRETKMRIWDPRAIRLRDFFDTEDECIIPCAAPHNKLRNQSEIALTLCPGVKLVAILHKSKKSGLITAHLNYSGNTLRRLEQEYGRLYVPQHGRLARVVAFHVGAKRGTKVVNVYTDRSRNARSKSASTPTSKEAIGLSQEGKDLGEKAKTTDRSQSGASVIELEAKGSSCDVDAWVDTLVENENSDSEGEMSGQNLDVKEETNNKSIGQDQTPEKVVDTYIDSGDFALRPGDEITLPAKCGLQLGLCGCSAPMLETTSTTSVSSSLKLVSWNVVNVDLAVSDIQSHHGLYDWLRSTSQFRNCSASRNMAVALHLNPSYSVVDPSFFIKLPKFYNEIKALQSRAWAVGRVKMGNKQNRNGDYPKAVRFYKEAIVLDPTLADAYVARATAYANCKKYKRAISDLHEALKIDANVNNAKVYLEEILKSQEAAREEADMTKSRPRSTNVTAAENSRKRKRADSKSNVDAAAKKRVRPSAEVSSSGDEMSAKDQSSDFDEEHNVEWPAPRSDVISALKEMLKDVDPDAITFKTIRKQLEEKFSVKFPRQLKDALLQLILSVTSSMF